MSSEVTFEAQIDAWRQSFHQDAHQDEFDWKMILMWDNPVYLSDTFQSHLKDTLQERVRSVIKKEYDLFRLKNEWAKIQMAISSEIPHQPAYKPAILQGIFNNQLEVLEKQSQETWHVIFCIKNSSNFRHSFTL